RQWPKRPERTAHLYRRGRGESHSHGRRGRCRRRRPPNPQPQGRNPMTMPLNAEELRLMHAYWRAANYLSVGQIYLRDNPLLKEKLTLAHVKPRLLGHWGTTPGLNFIYLHL